MNDLLFVKKMMCHMTVHSGATGRMDNLRTAVVKHKRAQWRHLANTMAYITCKQKLCTLDAKSTCCNCMTEMYTAGIWDPMLDNYPILVALRSLSLKPISFGCKTSPIRFSQAGGQSAHKAHPPNLELALTPLHPHLKH